MTGQDSADRVRRLLIDEGISPNYTDANILSCLNDATVAILNLKPTALVSEVNIAVTGPMVNLASNIIFLHDVSHNATFGSSVRRIDKKEIDYFDPGWRTANNPGVEIEHYMYDETNPRRVEFYPRTNDGVVVAYVTQIPAKITQLANILPLPDDFADAYMYYVAYKLLEADSDEVNNDQRADKFYARFAENLGVKIQNRFSLSPNLKGAQ